MDWVFIFGTQYTKYFKTYLDIDGILTTQMVYIHENKLNLDACCFFQN